MILSGGSAVLAERDIEERQLGQEIELKLDLTPQAAADFLASELASGDPLVLVRRAIYFDTPDNDLRAAGFSLRIREDVEGRLQIVKAVGASAASLFVRPKWERKLEADIPVLDDATPIRAFVGSRADALQPVFEVRTERKRWSVTWEGASIDMALDRGDVMAGTRRTPICEIELELVNGTPEALFSFARRLDAVAPLRLGVSSKAERGYLLLGPAPRAVKAKPIHLTLQMSVSGAFRIIADACLRQFRLNEALLETGDAEALHQARVALRRLRSALSLFHKLLEDDMFEQLKGELKWLAGVLGEVRDIDVLVARNKDGTLTQALTAARETAFRQAADDLESPRARALLLDFAAWLACGQWHGLPGTRETREQPIEDFAITALDRLRRKVKKSGKGLSGLDDEARHELRKSAKKLRYASEFFGSLFEGKRRQRSLERFLSRLEALQDQLGALNDEAAAPELLERLGLDGSPPRDIDRRKHTIRAAAKAHDAFVEEKRFWR